MVNSAPSLLQQQRFLSLDIFRGMTVCFMIIVNSKGFGATAYAPLLHADWHGFTPTDLVFPSFLFAVGNALSFADKKFTQWDTKTFFLKISKRSLIIYLLGFLMYWFPFFKYDDVGEIRAFPFAETRFLGVLQRIAICYFLASIVVRYFTFRGSLYLSLGILIGYWGLLHGFAPIPDAPFDLQDNLVLRIDQYILGKAHMYHKYGTYFDPEGILSTFPALVNVLVGYYAGKYLQEGGQVRKKLVTLLFIGLALTLLSLLWNQSFPINKKLWTSSFVCLTAGLSLMIMAIMVYFVEDGSKKHNALSSFFLVFGRNPLFIYLLSEILYISTKVIRVGDNLPFYEWVNLNYYQKVAPGAFGSLLFALSIMFFCWLIGYILDRNKVYVKV